MAATARLVVMMEPKQKKQLEAQAKDASTSVGEMVRRRLSHAVDPGEQAFLESLVELGDRVERLQERIRANDAAEANAKAGDAAERERICGEVAAWYRAAGLVSGVAPTGPRNRRQEERA